MFYWKPHPDDDDDDDRNQRSGRRAPPRGPGHLLRDHLGVIDLRQGAHTSGNKSTTRRTRTEEVSAHLHRVHQSPGPFC
jgi:hypothetical protein